MPEPPLDDLLLYMRNDVTVDSGASIDIRRLDDTNGNTSATQSVAAVNTADNAERTWRPTALGVAVTADAHTLQRYGWAVPVTDMDPSDSRCKALLKAQTISVSLRVACGWTGTPIGTPVAGAVFKASLWKYNPSTDAGTLIGTVSSTAQEWSSLQNNQVRTVTPGFTLVSDVEFATGEVLMVQAGLNVGTLGNPVAGSVTYTFTLNVDAPLTAVSFVTTGLRVICRETPSGASSPGGVLTNKPLIQRSGATTPTGILLKKSTALYTGATTPSGTLLKKPQTVYAGSISPFGTLVKELQRTLNGQTTPTGTIIRRVFKILVGQVTPIGTVSKTIRQTVRTGSITPSGALIKELQRLFSGQITSNGQLIKTIRRILNGQITPTGAIVVLTKLMLEGEISPSGTLVKELQRVFDAAITPSGELDNDFIAVMLFGGQITSSGELIRELQKFLVGQVSPTGMATTRLFKIASGSVSPTGHVTKTTKKVFTGAPLGEGGVTVVIKRPIVIDD